MTKCAITCAEPSCSEKIFYDSKTDATVPIYCTRHRTKFGRHAEVRNIGPSGKFSPLIPKPEVVVILRCASCKSRVEVPQSEWLKYNIQPECSCGKGVLLYHKDKHEPEDYP